MTKILKYLISIILLSLVSDTVYTQSAGNSSDFKYNVSDTVKSKNQSWKDFPFQIGADGGFAVPVRGQNYYTSGFFVHMNVNLYDRRVFLKLEGGKTFTNPDVNMNNKGYFSIGAELVFYKFDEKNKLSFDLGIGAYGTGDGWPYGGFKTGISYIHSLNRLWSIYGSVKLPAILPNRDNFYHNPLFTVGFKFL